MTQFTTSAGASLLRDASSSNGDERKFGSRGVRLAPFASISTSLIRQLGVDSTDGQARAEPHTHADFPLEFCMNKSQHPCPQLAGMGVRAKRLLGLKNINVYAVGVYVDGGAAKKVLGPKFKAPSPSDQALFDSLIASGSVPKTLRLVITFGHLRRGQFLDALEERLAPPLKQAGDTTALAAFKHQFDDVTFKKGLEIAFTQTGSTLVTQVDGREVGRLNHPSLNAALWGIYLGPDPVSPEAKSSLGATLAATLRAA